jgi:hypothetical protein
MIPRMMIGSRFDDPAAGEASGNPEVALAAVPHGSSGRRRGRRMRGQALAEFTMILPVFLLLTLGVVDMTRIFAGYISLTNGVREAAIFAGAAGYDAWCSSSPGYDAVPCPAGGAGHMDLGSNAWDSIAYRIQAEAGGIDPTKIVLAPPQCASVMDAAAFFGPCDATSVLVKIDATYAMPVLTPVLGAVLGGFVHLESTTVAAIIK